MLWLWPEGLRAMPLSFHLTTIYHGSRLADLSLLWSVGPWAPSHLDQLIHPRDLWFERWLLLSNSPTPFLCPERGLAGATCWLWRGRGAVSPLRPSWRSCSSREVGHIPFWRLWLPNLTPISWRLPSHGSSSCLSWGLTEEHTGFCLQRLFPRVFLATYSGNNPFSSDYRMLVKMVGILTHLFSMLLLRMGLRDTTHSWHHYLLLLSLAITF